LSRCWAKCHRGEKQQNGNTPSATEWGIQGDPL
jgi:hypothetical protein